MTRSQAGLAGLLFLVGLLLASCVFEKWEGPNPQALQSFGAEETKVASQVNLYIPQYLSQGSPVSKRAGLRPIREVIDALMADISMQVEHGVFQVTTSPPETGVFCSLYLEEFERPTLISAWQVMSILTATLIFPYYDSSLGYRVTYGLFVDAVLKKSYQYEVKGGLLFGGMVLLVRPFFSGDWAVQMNSSTDPKTSPELRKAIGRTLSRFAEDARRDGLLP